MVDRLEWVAMPDASTAAAALQSGEIDFIEQPSPDLLPTLERNRNIRMFAFNPVGSWSGCGQTTPSRPSTTLTPDRRCCT